MWVPILETFTGPFDNKSLQVSGILYQWEHYEWADGGK